jgi:hypothetical protein
MLRQMFGRENDFNFIDHLRTIRVVKAMAEGPRPHHQDCSGLPPNRLTTMAHGTPPHGREDLRCEGSIMPASPRLPPQQRQGHYHVQGVGQHSPGQRLRPPDDLHGLLGIIIAEDELRHQHTVVIPKADAGRPREFLAAPVAKRSERMGRP